MSEIENEPPDEPLNEPLDETAREAAVGALLAPVPVVQLPTVPQWHDVRQRAVDPKSLY